MLMLAFPILGMMYFSATNISGMYSDHRAHKEMQTLAQFAIKASAVVHEAQKERGMTAGFLGSKGKKFGESIVKQRALVDQRLADYQEFLSKLDIQKHGTEFAEHVQDIQDRLPVLGAKRAAVSNQSIKVKEAIGYYTGLNVAMLDMVAHIATMNDSGELVTMQTAYANFLQSKERAGIERAVLSNVFAQDQFAPGMERRFVALLNEQKAYTQVFISLATPEDIQFYQATMKGEAVDEVRRMREAALDGAMVGGFDIDPEYWFSMATRRINLLKQVEDHLSEGLIEYSTIVIEHNFQTIIFSVVVALGALLAAILITGFILRTILKQIKILHDSIDQMERDSDLTTKVEVQSKDEFGEMADSFNSMIDKFRSTMQNLVGTTVQISSAAEELSAVAEQTSQGVRQQQAETDQVSTAMNEMNATVHEVARTASETAESSQNAESESSKGALVATEALGGFDVLTREMENAANVVQKLEADSEDISMVLDVIQGIAEQTNLLALNAAIEAARAGEQGRGFAVVADEVRTLASRTQTSAEEIRGMIEQLQKGAQQAVVVMGTAQTSAQSGSEQVEAAAEALAEISGAVTNINAQNTQIATAAEEQTAVTEEINRNIVTISQLAGQTADGAQQTAVSSEDLARLSTELQQLAGCFKTS